MIKTGHILKASGSQGPGTMNSKNVITSDYTFVLGAVRYKDLIYFALQDDRVDSNATSHFYPITFDQGNWGGDIVIEWSPLGMTVSQYPIEQMLIINENGNVYTFGSGKEGFEKISNNGINPLERGGQLRKVRNISNAVYAVGMKRQAYRRIAENDWITIDDTVYTSGQNVVGFESLDGFDEGDLYAVGWEGEIWHFDGSSWSQLDSPTNIILLDVCCAGDNNVYISGQMGVLIVGRGNKWTLIDTQLKENIWNLVWFQDSLYFSTYSGIYKVHGSQIERINFKNDIPTTFYHLSSRDGLLVSIGDKDVMGFDGSAWFRIH